MTSPTLPDRPRNPAEWTTMQEADARFKRWMDRGFPVLMGVLAVAGSYLALTLAPGAFFKTPHSLGVYQAVAMATGCLTGLFLWFIIHEVNRRPSSLDAATPDGPDNARLERWKDEPDMKAYLQKVKASGLPLLEMDLQLIKAMAHAHTRREELARANRVVQLA